MVPAKSVPFSVRLPQVDAEYVASLEIPDALTPSDKIRHIIAQARKSSEPPQSLKSATHLYEEGIKSTSEQIAKLEQSADLESEILQFVGPWLLQACAEFSVSPQSEEDLIKFEAKMVRHVARLSEQMMRMALTTDAACYDPQVMKEKSQRTLELARLIDRNDVGVIKND